MAVTINKSAQADKKESLPLASTWYKQYPETKTLFLGVTQIKLSKNEEWFVVEVCGKFAALVNAESKQGEALMEMISLVEEEGQTLVCCYSSQTKSGVEFGLDDEIRGAVKFDGNNTYSLSWEHTVDGPFVTGVQTQTPTPQPPKKTKSKATGSSAPKQGLESTNPPF